MDNKTINFFDGMLNEAFKKARKEGKNRTTIKVEQKENESTWLRSADGNTVELEKVLWVGQRKNGSKDEWIVGIEGDWGLREMTKAHHYVVEGLKQAGEEVIKRALADKDPEKALALAMEMMSLQMEEQNKK